MDPRISVEELVHAGKCKLSKCKVKKCKVIKNLFQHIPICRFEIIEYCNSCYNFMTVAIRHSECCPERRCPVFFCEELQKFRKKINSRKLRNKEDSDVNTCCPEEEEDDGEEDRNLDDGKKDEGVSEDDRNLDQVNKNEGDSEDGFNMGDGKEDRGDSEVGCNSEDDKEDGEDCLEENGDSEEDRVNVESIKRKLNPIKSSLQQYHLDHSLVRNLRKSDRRIFNFYDWYRNRSESSSTDVYSSLNKYSNWDGHRSQSSSTGVQSVADNVSEHMSTLRLH
ncbi:hypothetical protein NPIL_347111 [Nephila pilipes]|uniref:TAZ-type domain-containing protein n=1 Tax=Nephila pilipes TaxID=299642 RepID=A0A8X6I4J5_NEPPI|nr:hypothetical protein NPIL_347111 [Nephila pilipes]